MFKFRQKQFITIVASLVILLAQFAALAHATEHPFHAEDSLCIVYQNAEQNKLLAAAPCAAIFNIVANYHVIADFSGHTVAAIFAAYSSRAPPAQTV